MLKRVSLVLAVVCLLPGMAMADSLVPSTFSTTLAVGGKVTIGKTLTITQAATAPVDVFFLADTTGSMGGAIANVKTNIGGIIGSVAAVAPNVAFGVGDYKDVGDAYIYRLDHAVTTDAAAVQAAVSTWSAGGGGDTPEAQLYALDQVATSAATAWRADSTRLLMWFGDAPGHDPSNGVTEAMATNDLVAQHIATYPISVGFNQLDITGQGTRIAAATGGTFYAGIDSSALTSTIISAITGAVVNYSTVGLGVIGLPAGVGLSFVPASYTGTFDRSIARSFGFDVGFTGILPGTYDFTIVGLVDGKIVAREADSITVTGAAVPEPASLLLLGVGLAGLGVARRRRR